VETLRVLHAIESRLLQGLRIEDDGLFGFLWASVMDQGWNLMESRFDVLVLGRSLRF